MTRTSHNSKHLFISTPSIPPYANSNTNYLCFSICWTSYKAILILCPGRKQGNNEQFGILALCGGGNEVTDAMTYAKRREII